MSLRSPRPGEPGFKEWLALADAVDAAGVLGAGVSPTLKPIDMVLHCPACGLQHIDAPWKPGATLTNDQITGVEPVWDNPPHRSHLCAGCGHIWRPADVPTNGVQAVKTKGKNDSKIVKPGCIECANAICDECVPWKGLP